MLESCAFAWGKDAEVLEHLLHDGHSVYSRGRGAHPRASRLVIHGDDAAAAAANWLEVAEVRFRLTRLEAVLEFNEHEKRLADHPRAVQAILGIPLDSKTTA